MSIWSSYPFARIVIIYIIGILSYSCFSQTTTVLIIGILILSYYLLKIKFRKKYPKPISLLFGFIILTIFFFIGHYRISLEDPVNKSNHLNHYELKQFDYFQFRIIGYPAEKTKHYIFKAEVLHAYSSDSTVSQKLTGNLSLYISKDSLPQIPQYGDILLSSKRPFPLSPPKNPYEFNYSQYMARKGIHHQLFITHDEFIILGNHPKNWLIAQSNKMRKHFKQVIEKNVTHKSARDISFALILGIKDDLDKELKTAYSSAGAMHVLAVSGLHVGIIHMMISWLLGFLKRSKWGRVLFLFAGLSILWAYAFITGLSPSVLRAVIMFSVMLIGNNTMRVHNVYNSLATSAFIILLFNPFMINEVGFQLSYAAVIGIVYLQPKIYQLIIVKNYLLDKAWAITCVSISAQVATFPLGLYYFHQFPTYFLISNLVVIPAAFIILLNGLGLLLSSFFNDFITYLLGESLSFFISWLNKAVLFVDKLPHSLISWIKFDFLQLLLIYLIMLLVIILFNTRNKRYLKLSLAACLLFQCTSGYELLHAKSKQQLVFYEMTNNQAIDFIDRGNVWVYLTDKEQKTDFISFQIGPNRLANALPDFNKEQLINSVIVDNMGELIQWKDQKILILNKNISKLEVAKKIDVNILILSGNQYFNPAQIKKSFNYQHLIIDSNYKGYKSSSLSGALTKMSMKHWNIKKQGAYLIDLPPKKKFTLNISDLSIFN